MATVLLINIATIGGRIMDNATFKGYQNYVNKRIKVIEDHLNNPKNEEEIVRILGGSPLKWYPDTPVPRGWVEANIGYFGWDEEDVI